MDKRKLRAITTDSFKTRMDKSRGLATLLDDGFVEVDRDELVALPMILLGWQLRPAITSGYEQARIWAMVQVDQSIAEDEVRKVKFRDAGRGTYTIPGIPEMLRELQDNGTTGDVAVMLRMENYTFVDRDSGEEVEASRYWFDDPEGNPLPVADDDPDF